MYAAGGPLSLLFLRRRIGISGPDDPPVNVGLPQIVGDPDVNFALTVTTGNWTGDPSEYQYQWLRNGDLIDGADNLAYALAEADVTKFVFGSVTAINAFGTTAAISLPVGPIVGIAPVNSVAPTVTGGSSPPKVGETVTANLGTWTGVPAPSLAIHWKRGSAEISGAVASTYSLQVADAGNTISVQVVGTNSAGSATATSAPTAAVVPGTDATVPVLSAFIVDPDGELAALMSVVTSKGNGTFYWVIVPDGSTAPGAAQIVAGTDGSGTPATSRGSILTATVTTYGNQPTGLSAGSVYDAYGVMYDAVGNVSNVVTDQFTTAGSDVPTLSGQAIVDFADIFLWVKATTNNGNGNWYAAACPAAATPPTGAQIVAGTDGSGNPVPHTSRAMTTTGEFLIQVRGLTQNTAYKTYLVHKVGSSYSNIVNVAHTSDIFVASWATTGATTGLSGLGAVFTANAADPYGGTNAVQWADSNDGAVAPAAVTITGAVIFGVGTVKLHMTEKWVSGAEFRRVSPMANVDAAASSTHWNAHTGLPTYNVGYLGVAPIVLPVGGGWFMFSTSKVLPGPDTNGIWNVSKATVDNSGFIVAPATRNGTHISLVYDIRATRAV
jgi:hypothetical protein